MPHLRFPIAPLTACGLALALVLGGMIGLTAQPLAQEQFFTQSGGRGLQNAKTNARLSKAENDIGVVQEDLKTIKPHARAELGNCDGEGEKLRFDGSNWICEKETDPTVQAFAKQPLPSCSGGKTLGIVGGNLGCSTTSFVTSESDPTVQNYAKQPLPTCAADQFLSVQGGALSCMMDQRGLLQEADPKVHDFARKDAVAAVPTCSPSELLTMTGGRLVCKIDQIGITEEADPKVQDFARNDIGEAALTSCGAGQVLRSTVGTSGKIIIACDSAASQLSEALTLGDLSDVDTAGQTSGTTLTYSNGQWRAIAGLGSADNPLFLSQLGDVTISAPASDDVVRWNGSRWVNSVDKISTMTDTNWCRVDGTRVVCDRPPPLTCAASEVLSWNGASSTWVCTDAATGIGQALSLNTLNDVTITTPAIGQALRYDGSGWANSTIERILAGDTQIVATDTGTDGLLSFATDGATRMAITNEGRVGIGVMPASPYLLDVGGAIRASGGISTTDLVAGNGVFSGNLTIGGNLNVSGAQSLDGVLFANGGIQAPGSVTAGGISATNVSVTQALTAATVGAQDVSISRNLTVAGNLDVLGDQSIGGVLFANGGIALSGDIQAGRISATYISGSVADIVTLRGDSLTYTNGNIGTATITQLNGTNISATTADLTTLRTAGLLTAQDVSISRNVTIAGNLDVLGNQSIAGVLFANGGIQLGGDIEAGRVSTTYLSSTLADIINLRVGNDQTIGGDLGVTGLTQLTNISASSNATIAGSLTANTIGTSALASTNISSTNLSASGATTLGSLTAASTTLTGLVVDTNALVRGNLTVAGNFYVSGSQTIDGVLFANGGITMPGALGSESISTTYLSATLADIRTLRVTNSQTIAEDLDVTGATTLTGLLTASNVSLTNVSATGNATIAGSLTANTIGTSALASTNISSTNLTASNAFTATSATLSGLVVDTNSLVRGNLTIGGNLFVSGSQTIDGVIFANGGIALSGAVESGIISTTYLSATLADIRTLRTTTISNSGNVTINGSLTAGSAGFGPLAASTLTITGGTQLAAVSATDISATGNISANTFIGSGAGLTNIPATGLLAAGVVGSVQFKGALNEISGTNTLTVTSAANRADLKVSGTVQLSGDTTESCTGTTTYGQIRFVDAGAGKLAMQICRP